MHAIHRRTPPSTVLRTQRRLFHDCGSQFVGVGRRWAALAVPLLVYLLTLAPTITWAHDGADGGDLITAAYTLGVPHPPGYPVYCLLGHLFAHLPLRDVAWRLNLMSAVGAGLAALGLQEPRPSGQGY